MSESQPEASQAPSSSSSYPGKFTFVNNFGQTIQSGTAFHISSSGGAESLDLSGLQDGAARGPQNFTAYDGESDDWGFKVTLANGAQYNIGEKKCDYERDEDSPRTVILNPVIEPEDSSNRTLYIIMPVSSNCDEDF